MIPTLQRSKLLMSIKIYLMNLFNYLYESNLNVSTKSNFMISQKIYKRTFNKSNFHLGS